jgi:hypothetical protein
MRSGRTLIVSLLAILAVRVALADEKDSCAAQCGMDAEQSYRQCVDDGGSETDCKAAARATFQACIESSCDDGAPQDCQGKCEDVAAHVEDECLEKCGDGEDCAETCAQAKSIALDRCAKELCGEPDPGCGGDDARKCCIDECRDLKHGVFAACIATEGDGEDAKKLCSERADDAFRRCKQEHCDLEPEAPCEERCARTAGKAFESCLADGTSEEVCLELKVAMKEQCLAKRCADPEPTCKERCQGSADGAFVACVADGGIEEACKALAAGIRDECVAAHCDEPDAACTDRCIDAVIPIVEACVEAGFDQAFCNGQGEEAVRHCVDAHCDGDPKPSCRERCAGHARHEYGRCLEDGGTPVDCKATAKDEYASCARIHCDPAKRCVARCDKKAGRAERRCRKSGKSDEACAAAGAGVLEACTAGKCAPKPPDTCDSECEGRAAAVEEDCIAAGNAADDCAAAKQGVLDQCTIACGGAPDETCSETCEDAAQAKFATVRDRTGDEDKAGKRGQRTFRKCERTCGDG